MRFDFYGHLPSNPTIASRIMVEYRNFDNTNLDFDKDCLKILKITTDGSMNPYVGAPYQDDASEDDLNYIYRLVAEHVSGNRYDYFTAMPTFIDNSDRKKFIYNSSSFSKVEGLL